MSTETTSMAVRPMAKLRIDPWTLVPVEAAKRALMKGWMAVTIPATTASPMGMKMAAARVSCMVWMSVSGEKSAGW